MAEIISTKRYSLTKIVYATGEITQKFTNHGFSISELEAILRQALIEIETVKQIRNPDLIGKAIASQEEEETVEEINNLLDLTDNKIDENESISDNGEISNNN